MNKRFWILGLCCFIVILSQSIFFGAVGDPGSQEDPVITESFFNNAISGINNSITQLNSSINSLNTNVSSLTTRVSALESKSTTGTTTSASDADVRILAHLSKLNLDKKFGATIASNVALKSQPSDSSTTLTIMPYYAGFNILDAQSGWIKIQFYSYNGWVPYDKIIPIMLR